MNTCEFDGTRLQDYIDGELGRDERAAVERHLSTCADCRFELRALRELIEASGNLGPIEPARDLFPGIAARIGSPASAPASGIIADRAKAHRPSHWLAAAAALLLALVGGGLGWWWRGEAQPAQSAAVRPAVAVLAADHSDGAALSEIVAATDALADFVEGRRSQISPETAAILERNLAIIDRAIVELRQHRQSIEPGGQTLALSAMYRQKLELLRRAARLSS